MEAGFEAVGSVVLPKGVDLSGGMWVQAAVDVYEGGRWEKVQGPKIKGLKDNPMLINVGGRKVGSFVGPAKSFMRNWAVSFIRNLFYVPSNTPESYTDDGGVARFNALFGGLAGSGQGVDAAAADFAFGDNNGAVNANQFNLLGLILGPTGPITATVLQEDNAARIFKVEGTVLNGGGAFNIQEVGLFPHLRQGDLAGQNRRSMFMRDIVNPLVAVGNGQTALGRYTFTAAI